MQRFLQLLLMLIPILVNNSLPPAEVGLHPLALLNKRGILIIVCLVLPEFDVLFGLFDRNVLLFQYFLLGEDEVVLPQLVVLDEVDVSAVFSVELQL